MPYVYLLHFDRPYKHARHYAGFTKDDLDARIERHRTSPDVRLLQVIKQAGIGFQLVRVWSGEQGTRERERAIKRNRLTGYCPLCKHERLATARAAYHRRRELIMSKEDYDFDSKRDEALCAQGEDEMRWSYAQEIQTVYVYTPHCPECLSARLLEMCPTWLGESHVCENCGHRLKSKQAVALRSLTPQPAPPYTGAEIMSLAYGQGYIL